MSDKVFPGTPQPPGQGDKLFVRGSDRRSTAWLSHQRMWDAYAMGYKLAADLLAQHVADNIVHRNLLGFPVLFLYRQYLELRIKELGVAAAQFLGRSYDVPTHHDLPTLWQGVRPILDTVFPESAGHLEAVEHRISEFSGVDPRSYVFRYPVDTRGKPTLPVAPAYIEVNSQDWPVSPPAQPGLKQVDVAHLRQIMAGIAAVLDGCSDGLYEAQRAKWDEWAEMGGGCEP